VCASTDRFRWNQKYRDEIDFAPVNPTLRRYAELLKRGRVLDLAGGMGQNGAWLASHSNAFRVVDADVSDEALARVPKEIASVVVDAGDLPFMRNVFDTILNIRFFDPRVSFSGLLTAGGTVFFETFSSADAKYRPNFNPAHRFELALLPKVFAGLEILVNHETDDGSRVYLTIIAQKNP